MLLLICTLLAFANEDANGHSHKCHGHDSEEWSYENQRAWAQRYPACNGTRQSPINIDTTKVKESNIGEDLQFVNYDQPASGILVNNGHTVQHTITDGVERSIQGTGLPEDCTLIQYHFHWGSRPTRGSEHQINGRRFPMEVHLVHRCPDTQLVVLGMFFKEKGKNNRGLGPLVKKLKEVRNKGKQTELNSFDVQQLLPRELSYFFSYSGSLTTPGCNETVTWMVFPDPIIIGIAQMEEFRNMLSTKESDEHQCKMQNNYRSVQPLNDRTVSSLREDFKR